MRLSDYLIRPISTSTVPSGQYNLQLEAYNLAVNLLNKFTSPIADTDDMSESVINLMVQEYITCNNAKDC